MSLQRNLQLGRNATHYVRSRMTLGAANRLGETGPLTIACVFYGKVAAYYDSHHARPRKTKNGVDSDIRSIAERAEKNGCGNCGEQACLAFTYLADHGAKRLALVERAHKDHQFVLLAWDKTGRPHDYTTWGHAAVVCDPWAKKAYPALDIPKHMSGNTYFRFMRIL